MKKHTIILIISMLLVMQGCAYNNEQQPQEVRPTEQTASPLVEAAPETEEDINEFSGIIPTDEASAIGITPENYPRIDGSTSTLPLAQEIFRTMFKPATDTGEFTGYPEKASKTMKSYELLIAGDVDLILVPDPSKDIENKVSDAGIELEYIPIGAEALVFITHKDNQAENITKEQAVEIYCSMSINNWSQLGGADGRIVPICRNTDSGSQAQMENLILEGKSIAPEIEENFMERDMNGMLQMVEEYEYFAREGEKTSYAIGYTMYYYMNVVESVMGELYVKPLSFNGVAPSPETILSKEYPLATNYYVVIRKDTQKEHPARILADWLVGNEGQWHVAISGLGALKPLYEPTVQGTAETETDYTLYELNDITMRYPSHWAAEKSEVPLGYSVEFFNPEIDKTIRHYTNAYILVEEDVFKRTAQEWVDYEIDYSKNFQPDPIFNPFEYNVIDISGVKAAHMKAHPDNDIYRIYEIIRLPYNGKLYTMQFFHSAGWEKEVDIFTEMVDSITVKQ